MKHLVINFILKTIDIFLQLMTPPSVLVFHENCGTNIRLTICNTSAKKINPEHIGDGVVVSRDVMVANVLYEVMMTLDFYYYLQ